MSAVIANIRSDRATPQRLVGAVQRDKNTNMLTIDYKVTGKVKPVQKSFKSEDVIAYCTGDNGFVVSMGTEPIATVMGEHIVKNGQDYLKTDKGLVMINKQPGIMIDYVPVDPESREARQAERAANVGIKKARTPRAERPAKPGKTDRAAKTERPAKTGKTKRVAEAAPASGERKKKKRAA